MVDDEQTGRRLNWSGLVLLAGVALIAVLLWRGVADPLPTGDPDGRAGSELAPVPLGQRDIVVRSLPVGAWAVAMTGRWDSAAIDGRYGLRLTSGPVALWVSIERGGDVGVWVTDGVQTTLLRPSGPWPHAHPAPVENEIVVIAGETGAAVWVNRELLLEGAAAGGWTTAAIWGAARAPGARLAGVELRWHTER